MVTTTSWREVFCSSAVSLSVRSSLVCAERILASSTTRPVSFGKFGSAGESGAAMAGAMKQTKAKTAAKSLISGYGCVPGCAAAGAGGGAVLVAPGKLTTGADCAAVLAANGVAC